MQRLISLVIPVYNVAAYLPEFLSSLEKQEFPITEIDIVFVDDGSPDDSATLIQQWIDRVGVPATLVRKANGGLSSARNAGLDVATGRWVSFPDPDDVLAADYLKVIAEFITSSSSAEVQLIAANLLILDDETGLVTNSHPLRRKFAKGRRIVSLDADPDSIHLQAASAFYRLAMLNRFGLRFDHEIRPNFEDAFLTAVYLSHAEQPRVAVIPEAHYQYRRRSDGSSLVQSSWTNSEKYTLLPRQGYLRLLRMIAAERGHVPIWVQNLVIYDLIFYLREDAKIHSGTAQAGPEVLAQFHRTLEEIAEHLDVGVIDEFTASDSSRQVRKAILLGAKHAFPRPAEVSVTRYDHDQHLCRISYYFTGDLPDEDFRIDASAVTPSFAKVRSVVYLGRTMMLERIAWVPLERGRLTVALDGVAKGITIADYTQPQDTISRAEVTQAFLRKRRDSSARPQEVRVPIAGRSVRARLVRVVSGQPAFLRPLSALHLHRTVRLTALEWKRLAGVRYTRLRAAGPLARQRYRSAWLLLDRDSQAQDNAEHLYRYLRREQPAVNAWFVLSPTSTDWPRLQKDGFRLIEHGSQEHRLALLNADHVVSSQIDHYVVRPLNRRDYGKHRWRYTFLQHGVTKDDLSRWINHKPIDLMVTATPDEHATLVDDHTPYIYTEREVRMTGFPRHDRLLRMAAEPTEVLRELLIMPTWRRDLLGKPAAGGNDRLSVDGFWQSGYATAWLDVIASERLYKAADRAGWTITFIPHPNMQTYVAHNPLPPHVAVHSFSAVDIQRQLARAALLLTDYSSMAFEMAYLHRPVVYYQFDQQTFFNGNHAYRKGSWSYEDNGFGPVTVDAVGAIDAIEAIAERGSAEARYAERMRRTFTRRDGRCSQRTYEAIAQITELHRGEQ